MEKESSYGKCDRKFLRYVKVDTQSDELSEHFQVKKQFNLAGMHEEELKNMGVSDVYLMKNIVMYMPKIPQIQRENKIYRQCRQ